MNLPEALYVDVGLYCGSYPFRPLPARDPEGLRALLGEAGAEAAVVTPFPVLFYNRSWEGLREWLEAFHTEPTVRFWAVVNPEYPGWERDVELASAEPGIAGLRLFPRYHGYGPAAPSLLALLERAAAAGLPVNLTARLLDDRLHPRMLHADPPLDLQEVGLLLKRSPQVTWVLSGFYASELPTLYPTIRAHPSAYVDIGCCKPPEFWWEEIVQHLPPERLLLGTGAPLYYHGGTRLSLHRSPLPDEVKTQILRTSAHRLLFASARVRSDE